MRVVLDKTTSAGTVEKDKRGSKPFAKLASEKINAVREHRASLATVSSYYSRAKSPHRRYLPVGMNMKNCIPFTVSGFRNITQARRK